MKKLFFFSFLFLFLFSIVFVSSQSFINPNRDRSLDDIAGKIPNIVEDYKNITINGTVVQVKDNSRTGFNYNLSEIPNRLPIRVIERGKDVIIGNEKTIIISSKKNNIDYLNAIFNARYLSIENSEIIEPVEVIMWVGTDGVDYGITSYNKTNSSFKEGRLNGEHLFNVKSRDGYLSFEVEHFSNILAGLPDVALEETGEDGQHYTIDLDDYCSPSCHPTSTSTQFFDPQTGQTETTFGQVDYGGFYFDVEHVGSGFTNVILFDGDNPYAGTFSITVFVGQQEFNSEDSDTFILRVVNQVPIQIQSIPDIDLGESGVQTIFFNDVFSYLSYDSIRVSWTDDVLMQGVFVDRDKDETSNDCEDGEILMCLRGTGSNIRLDIESKGLDGLIDVNVLGRALYLDDPQSEFLSQGTFRITSSEPESPPIPVDPPIQVQSIPDLNIGWNSGGSRFIEDYYVNQTNNLTEITFLNLTSMSNITLSAGQSAVQDEVGISLSASGSVIQVDSFTSNQNITIYINVSNSGGSIEDTFGTSNFDVNIFQTEPLQIQSITPLEMSFSTQSIRQINDFFTNYINASIIVTNVSNSSQNITLQRGASISFTEYNLQLSNLDQIIINSQTSEIDFLIWINVTGGGVDVIDDLQVSILESVAVESEGGLSGAFAGLSNLFSGIFPNKDTLTGGQKGSYVIIILIVVTGGLILISHNQTGGIPQSMIWILLIVDVALFFFFVAIGYIPIIVPIFVFIIGGVIVWLRLKGGG